MGDPRLTDASALCFHGVWFTKRHRVRVGIALPATMTDFPVNATAKHCGYNKEKHSFAIFAETTGPEAMSDAGHLLVGCMRVFSQYPRLSARRNFRERTYFKKFPKEASALDQMGELHTLIATAKLLQDKLQKLQQQNKVIRQRFGGDTVARRPTSKVREAEIVAVATLLRYVNEAIVVITNPDLYDKMASYMRHKGGTEI